MMNHDHIRGCGSDRACHDSNDRKYSDKDRRKYTQDPGGMQVKPVPVGIIHNIVPVLLPGVFQICLRNANVYDENEGYFP